MSRSADDPNFKEKISLCKSLLEFLLKSYLSHSGCLQKHLQATESIDQTLSMNIHLMQHTD